MTGTSTTGAPASCGPPCDELRVFEGELQVDVATDPSSLRCLVEITGSLTVSGSATHLLPELANLRRVGGRVDLSYAPNLSSLAGLECLEEIGESLQLGEDPLLTDIDALAGLERLGGLWISGNELISDLGVLDGVIGARVIYLSRTPAITRLPVLAPGSELTRLELEGCDAITDLDPLAGVAGSPESLEVTLVDNPALASVAGLADLWPASASFAQLRLRSLPKLASLAGFAGVDDASLMLRDLALIDDLGPLAGLESLDALDLDGMPKLKTLAPLAGLRRVLRLQLGSCTADGGQGLDGLTDITALQGLEELVELNMARNAALTTLPSLPALQFPVSHGVVLIDNPSLPTADAVAFVEMHGGCAEPPGTCSCSEDAPHP